MFKLKLGMCFEMNGEMNQRRWKGYQA